MKKYIRIQDPKELDPQSILSQAVGENEVILQFSETVTNVKLLQKVNDLCKVASRNLCVRFYGHYETGLDCAVLEYLPDVKTLYLDCLNSVINFAELRNLNSLENLNIGIYKLDEKDFLSWDNLNMVSSLSLSETQKNDFDLKYLAQYRNLASLFLSGHTKSIDIIGSTSRLSELTLSIPSKAPIGFVNQLSELKKLRLVLGGRANLDEIHTFGIEELEIVRVRGFSSFDNISEFVKLKSLLLEDQIQIEKISFIKELPRLDDLRILNCKKLVQLDGVRYLPVLHQLQISRTAIKFLDFTSQDLPKSLKVLGFNTGRPTENRGIKTTIEKMGYVDWYA